MRRFLAFLLTVILLTTTVPALAKVQPASIIGPDTRFAVVDSGLPESLFASVNRGEFSRTGMVTGVGEGSVVQSLTEGLLLA